MTLVDDDGTTQLVDADGVTVLLEDGGVPDSALVFIAPRDAFRPMREERCQAFRMFFADYLPPLSGGGGGGGGGGSLFTGVGVIFQLPPPKGAS